MFKLQLATFKHEILVTQVIDQCKFSF